MPERGARYRIVIQSGDVPQADGQVHRGLAVGSIKCSVFGRMLIKTHGDVEGSLNVCHWSFKLYVHGVA